MVDWWFVVLTLQILPDIASDGMQLICSKPNTVDLFEEDPCS
jgi:hypothetical protein